MTDIAIRDSPQDERLYSCDAAATGAENAVQRLLRDPGFRRWLDRSCANQNVPTVIADPGTVARVVTLLR